MASAKGLQSLIPQKRTEVKKSTKKEKAGKNRENIYLIDVEDIQPNPNQPRREFDQDALHELAASIAEHGVLLPIVARKIQQDITYIAGSRDPNKVWHVGNSFRSDVKPALKAGIWMIYIPYETWAYEREHDDDLTAEQRSRLITFGKITDVRDNYHLL